MPDDLVRNYRFRVTLTRSAQTVSGSPPTPAGDDTQRLGDGAFQECTGLDLEVDVQELVEGGRNDGVIRRVGRAKLAPIVLKRGMLHGDDGTRGELWTWLQGVVTGVRPVARYDGLVEVLSPDGEDVVATWTFDRGLPQKIGGPALNAKTGDVAIEELQIVHEGLRLVIE